MEPHHRLADQLGCTAAAVLGLICWVLVVGTAWAFALTSWRVFVMSLVAALVLFAAEVALFWASYRLLDWPDDE